jgi:hypothetical protein
MSYSKNAYRDDNAVPTLIGVSSADGQTPTRVAVDSATGRILVDLAGGAVGYQQPLTGAVNGSNQTFTWTTAPNVMAVDQGRVMQKISSDGTVNWTGTTTTVLSIAPIFDVYGVN